MVEQEAGTTAPTLQSSSYCRACACPHCNTLAHDASFISWDFCERRVLASTSKGEMMRWICLCVFGCLSREVRAGLSKLAISISLVSSSLLRILFRPPLGLECPFFSFFPSSFPLPAACCPPTFSRVISRHVSARGRPRHFVDWR